MNFHTALPQDLFTKVILVKHDRRLGNTVLQMKIWQVILNYFVFHEKSLIHRGVGGLARDGTTHFHFLS